MPFKHDYFRKNKLHTYIYSILSGDCDFPGIVGIFRCGALTAVLIGYSMESDGVCGEVIYIFLVLGQGY